MGRAGGRAGGGRGRGGDLVRQGVDVRHLYESVEWEVLENPAERHARLYPCCPDPYIDITFNLTLRRRVRLPASCFGCN